MPHRNRSGEEQVSSIAGGKDIKCSECGGENVRPCTRVDEYGREWIDNSCETCGHNLSLEEIKGARGELDVMMQVIGTQGPGLEEHG
jgi:hypothetical protein